MRCRPRWWLACLLLGPACIEATNVGLPAFDDPSLTPILAYQDNRSPVLTEIRPGETVLLSLPDQTDLYILTFADFEAGPGPLLPWTGPQAGKAVERFTTTLGGGGDGTWRSISDTDLPSWLTDLFGEPEPCRTVRPFRSDKVPSLCAMAHFGRDAILIARADGDIRKLQPGEGSQGVARVTTSSTPRSLFVFDQERSAWMADSAGRFFELDLVAGTVTATVSGVFSVVQPAVAIDGAPDGSEIFAVALDGELARYTPADGWGRLLDTTELDHEGNRLERQRRTLRWVGPWNVMDAYDVSHVRHFVDGEARFECAYPSRCEDSGERFTAVFAGGDVPMAVANVNTDDGVERFLFRFDDSTSLWVREESVGWKFQTPENGDIGPSGIWIGGTAGALGFHPLGSEGCFPADLYAGAEVSRTLAIGELGERAVICALESDDLVWVDVR